MTNSHSDSTELQENQDKPSYQKLPCDEENGKALDTSNRRLSVEVELNRGTKESSTDDDSLKDNPLIANGDHGGSVKKLNGSKISLNGDLKQSKKLDEDEEEEEDQESFMFGMSKLRTFFFFLSLALLVVFVLVFVFVLPCSESAQMNDRTNHITDQAVPGLTSKTGDMDGDGVDDLVYFKNSAADSNQRARRDTDDGQDCIVDGNSQSCAGQIVIVSSKVGSPIATRSVALAPQSLSSAGKGPAAIDCVSGGDRKKIVCTFQNNGKYYVIDMKKTTSNMTSVATDGCSQISMTPVSTKEATSFGFIVGCFRNGGGFKYSFVDGTTLKSSGDTLTQYDASMQPMTTRAVSLMDDSGKKATVLASLLKNGETVELLKISALVLSNVAYGNIATNVGNLLSSEGGLNVDIKGLDPSKEWNMVFVGNELVLFSSENLVVPRKDKDNVALAVVGDIKSVAPASENSKPVANVLMKVCSSNNKCTFQLATIDDSSDALKVTKKTVELDSMDDMPVTYINGPQYAYFTSWYFKKVTKPETAGSETSEKVDDNGGEDSNTVKDGEDSENENNVQKRSAEEEKSVEVCAYEWEATLMAYSQKSFSNPMPIYSAHLCSGQSVSFIGVTKAANGEFLYTLSVNKGPVSSLLTISLPEGKVVTRSTGLGDKLPWEHEE